MTQSKNHKNAMYRKKMFKEFGLTSIMAKAADNKSELMSLTVALWAKAHNMRLELIKFEKLTQNSFIGRINRKCRTEILDFHLFITRDEGREITDRGLTDRIKLQATSLIFG